MLAAILCRYQTSFRHLGVPGLASLHVRYPRVPVCTSGCTTHPTGLQYGRSVGSVHLINISFARDQPCLLLANLSCFATAPYESMNSGTPGNDQKCVPYGVWRKDVLRARCIHTSIGNFVLTSAHAIPSYGEKHLCTPVCMNVVPWWRVRASHSRATPCEAQIIQGEVVVVSHLGL